MNQKGLIIDLKLPLSWPWTSNAQNEVFVEMCHFLSVAVERER